MKIKVQFFPFTNNQISRTSFRSALMTVVLLLPVLCGVKLLAPISSSAKQSQQRASGQQSEQSANGQRNVAQKSQGGTSCQTCSKQQRIIYAPLFDLPESSGTELALNCRSAHDMVLTPIFYTLEGEAYKGNDVTLKPNEIRFVDTKSLIPENERNRHKWGGMAFSYVGGFMEAWAQLTLRGIRGGGSVNVLFTVLSQKRSNTAEAVWWTPRGGSAVIALGNSSDQPVRANLSFASGKSEWVDVRPFATEIVRLNSDVQTSAAFNRGDAVSIKYIGPEGSLIPTGYTSSANGSFASMIRFYDAQQIVQQHLYATNFRIKDTKPYMVLRNISGNLITATPTYLPPSGDANQSVKLPPVQLAPSEVVEVDLDPLLKAASNRSDLDSVSVQVSNTGNAGSLIGALYGFNTQMDITYDVPLRDSGPPRASTGGYSVRFDKDYTTVVAISNTTDQPGEFTMQINYAGGPYVTGIIPVAPRETKTYDIRKLRDEQKPDINGHPLPRNLKIAQVKWSVRGKARLNGRAEVVSIKDKISSSYSCFLCCGYSFASAFMTVSGSRTMAPSGTVSFTAWEQDSIAGGQSCGSDPAPYPVSPNVWWSDNQSVATINSTGTATGGSSGYAGIYASWTAYRNEWDDIDQSCEQSEEYVEVLDGVTVVGVEKFQYQSDTTFTDVSGTLYVLKGTSVTFKAIPSPANESWPSGKPVWGGTAGATGTGATKSVTFNTASSSTSDFKTVTAESGNTVTVNIIVYELTGVLTPQDNFSGRSLISYGLAEIVNLSFNATPSVTATQAGGLRWKIISGGGNITATDSGTGTYTAPATAGMATLKLEILSGPSKGGGPSYSISIIAPSGINLVQHPGSGIRHTNGTWSVGFLADWYLLPKNVSFSFIQVGEGSVAAVTSGYLNAINATHTTNGPFSVGSCSTTTGCKVMFLYDQIFSGQLNPPFSIGDFLWAIPVEYRVNAGSRVGFATWNHHATADATGRACIDKVVGPFCKNSSDPTSSW